MDHHPSQTLPMVQAGQDFSRTACTADKGGPVVIHPNDIPRCGQPEYGRLEAVQQAGDGDVLAASKRLMEKNKPAYEVLAQ